MQDGRKITKEACRGLFGLRPQTFWNSSFYGLLVTQTRVNPILSDENILLEYEIANYIRFALLPDLQKRENVCRCFCPPFLPVLDLSIGKIL